MAERTPTYQLLKQRDAKRTAKPIKRPLRRVEKPPDQTTAGATMSDPFPGHHPRPVSVDTLNGIENVATAIQKLHEAMTATSETHRFLATSMMSDEVGDVLRMIQVDQQQFAAQGLRDHSGLITMTPVAGPPTT